MANQGTVNPNGGNVTWALTISHLKAGVYRALVYDSSNTILEKWEDQRTDDNLPDTFTIQTPASKLKGCVLYWEAEVYDPSDEGGPYVCTISVEQDGSVFCQDAVSSQVSPGSGQRDPIGDQISFV